MALIHFCFRGVLAVACPFLLPWPWRRPLLFCCCRILTRTRDAGCAGFFVIIFFLMSVLRSCLVIASLISCKFSGVKCTRCGLVFSICAASLFCIMVTSV